jgi:zinc protease
MFLHGRAALAALLSALIVVCLPLARAEAQSPPAAPQAARVAWGFDRSNLTPDPRVRFGVLPNGMRYALMPNPTPAGGLSVRLHLDAGSIVEGKGEQGFMHLIEHMIFHGSPNIPEGALPMMLAREGLRRWNDFNAFTGHDETVYLLDLARADARARETALMLMREIAGGLVFERRAVQGAKAKVREEIAARDAVQDRLTSARDAFFMPGTKLARPVAGSGRSVSRATPEALRRLYERHYMPSNATLILVGDIEPAAVEAEIAARFADWQGSAEPAPPPVMASAARGIKARLFVDRRAATAITIATVEPLGEPDAVAPRDLRFLQHLAGEMLTRRLSGLAAGPDAPFSGGSSGVYDYLSTAKVAQVELAARDRDWRRALRAGAAELRRALDGGFSETELAEQLALSRRSLARDAAPRTSPAVADAIVDAVGRRLVFTAPDDAAAAEAYLASVRLTAVNAAFRASWASPGRLLFVSHNRRVPDAKAAIAAAWATHTSPVEARPPRRSGRGIAGPLNEEAPTSDRSAVAGPGGRDGVGDDRADAGRAGGGAAGEDAVAGPLRARTSPRYRGSSRRRGRGRAA